MEPVNTTPPVKNPKEPEGAIADEPLFDSAAGIQPKPEPSITAPRPAAALRPESETSELQVLPAAQTTEPTLPDSSVPHVPAETTLLPAESPKKSQPHWIGLAIGIAAATVLLAGAGIAAYVYFLSTAKPPVTRAKIGVMMAFTGGSASMGYGVNKGIQLAKKQLGADNLEIVQIDSKCDPKTAAESARQLIAQKVVAIIGEGCSSATVAALPALNNAKIPLISPSASSPTLSIPNDYFFRVIPPDDFQGAFMAKEVYTKGYHNTAIFYTNEPYGNGMNDVFQQSFTALGGKVVASATAEPDVIDLKPQLQRIKAAKPEALFIAPNSVVTATAVMKIAREIGITVPIYGADIMYDNTIVNNLGKDAEGLIVSTFATGSKGFKQALFNESQKTEVLFAAPQGYDIVHLLQIAVQRGATTGEQVKNMLPNIEFQGMSGYIRFDVNGEISDKNYEYDLFQVKDGVFTLLEQ